MLVAATPVRFRAGRPRETAADESRSRNEVGEIKLPDGLAILRFASWREPEPWIKIANHAIFICWTVATDEADRAEPGGFKGDEIERFFLHPAP